MLLSGFDVESICPTVPNSHKLVGFGEESGNTSLLRKCLGQREDTPIHVHTLVLQDDETSIGIISMDVLGLDADFAEQLKDEANEANIRALLISASHTHSAPSLISTSIDGPRDEEFSEQVLEVAKSSFKNALANLKPVTLSSGQGESSVNLNRHAVWYNESRPIDSTVKTLQISEDLPESSCCLVRFSCHPTCFNRSEISSDYVGYLESALRPTQLIFLNGCSGYLDPKISGVDVSGRGEEYAKGVAEELKTVINSAEKKTMSSSKLSFATRPINWRVNAKVDRLVSSLPKEVTALRIGQVVIVGLPGEPFVETGRAIQSSFPEFDVWVVGYTDGYIGYLIDSISEEQGKQNLAYYVAGTGPATAPEQIGYRISALDTSALQSAAISAVQDCVVD